MKMMRKINEIATQFRPSPVPSGLMKIVILLVMPLLAAAQSIDRIRAVETGLMTAVVLKGQPVPRHTIEERMKALNVPGVSVAVIRDYKIEWAKGYGLGDVATKRPVTTDTLFLAGSISKPVASAGALSLVEQGKVKLDDDVNSYLKSWKVPENEFTKEQKVTLRRLLSHTAGLTVHGFPGYSAASSVPTIPQILDGVKPANTAAVRVDLLPGSMFRYSGGGYTVAQLMMIEVTSVPFQDFMQRAVLEKAGMRQSTYENPLPQRLAAVAASGYKSNGDVVPGRYHTYPEMAAAGLWTTASDLARFVIEIQKSREGRSNRILKQATIEEMLRPEKQNYGLGFEINERNGLKQFGHDGSDAGFQAQLSATVDGSGIVVMTNSENGSRLALEIRLAVAAAYGWPDKPREREAIAMTPEALEKFSGDYEANSIGTIKIRVQGDHLVLTIPRRGEVALYPQSADAFFSLDAIPDLRFAADGSSFTAGNVTAKRVK
jgi:CubicO group peptidase (beta-lactamase class C family)